MKRNYFILMLFTLLNWSAEAQRHTFIYDTLPETIFPDASSLEVNKVAHVSCVQSPEMRVYSWSSEDINSPAGIVVVSTDFPVPIMKLFTKVQIQELEVAICGLMIIASYYVPGEGVFVELLYQHGYLLRSKEKRLLSVTGKKPRITSIQPGFSYIPEENYVAITWEDTNGIMVKAIKGGFFWDNILFGKELLISGTSNGKIPDISLGSVNGKKHIYISYLDPVWSNIKVIRQEFYNVFAPLPPTTSTISFDSIDEYDTRGTVTYIDICCPAMSHDEKWAYTFTMGGAIHARGYSTSLPDYPLTFSISDHYTSFNLVEQRKPSISFVFSTQAGLSDEGFDDICIAWSSKGKVQTRGLFSVVRGTNGTYVTPDGDFHIIPTSPDHSEQYGHVAISKTSPYSNRFLAYSINHLPTGKLEMRYKDIPAPFSYSRNQGETADVEQFSVSSLTAYPNPFGDYFQLEAENYEQGQQVDLQLIDFAGRIIFSTKGDVNDINTQLKTACPDLNSGIYVVKINGNEQRTIKIVKQ